MPYRLRDETGSPDDDRERFDDPVAAAAVRGARAVVASAAAAVWVALTLLPLFAPGAWYVWAALGVAPLVLLVRTLDRWETLSSMERIGSLVRFDALEAHESDLRWAQLTGTGRGARLRLRVEARGQDPRDLTVLVRPDQHARVRALVDELRDRAFDELDERPTPSATPAGVRRYRRRQWALVALDALAVVALSLVAFVLFWRGHPGHALWVAGLTLALAYFGRVAYVAVRRGVPVRLTATGFTPPSGTPYPWSRYALLSAPGATLLVEEQTDSDVKVACWAIAEPPELLEWARERARGRR